MVLSPCLSSHADLFRCPLDGPEHCPASCYLEGSNLQWCLSDSDCTGANLLGAGASIDVSAGTLGAGTHRVWLWAYDSNGQAGKVPTEVIIR